MSGLVLGLLACGPGPVVWTKTIAEDCDITATALASDGIRLVAVGTKGNPETGPTSWLIQSLRPDGGLLWLKEYSDSEVNVASDVALNRRGESHIVGWSRLEDRDMCTVVKYRADGSAAWKRGLAIGDANRGKGVSITEKGILVCGTARAGAEQDLFVVLLDHEGKTAWTKSYDFGPVDSAFCIDADEKGNSILLAQAGNADNSDLLLVKLDPNGDTIWTRRYDSGGPDRPGEAVFDPFGNVLATATGCPDGQSRCVILEYHPDGELIRKTAYGEKTQAQGNAIHVTAQGDVYIAGARCERGQTSILAFQYKPGATSVWEREYRTDRDHIAVDVVVEGDVFVLGATKSSKGNRMTITRFLRPSA